MNTTIDHTIALTLGLPDLEDEEPRTFVILSWGEDDGEYFELRELVREVLREDLGEIEPSDVPSLRLFAQELRALADEADAVANAKEPI